MHCQESLLLAWSWYHANVLKDRSCDSLQVCFETGSDMFHAQEGIELAAYKVAEYTLCGFQATVKDFEAFLN